MNTGLFDLEVRCYSGLSYAERPEAFCWQGNEYRVSEIIATWLEPGKKCFRVRVGDNKLFRLCYNESNGQWSITELVRS
ncbi:MAG TPA: hypothetical protein G4O07_09710 [Dehalococcoidia bacterium]|nr:hypothetical protein [Dehalococcoidia bacterium]